MSVDVYINIVYIVPTIGGVVCNLLFTLVLYRVPKKLSFNVLMHRFVQGTSMAGIGMYKTLPYTQFG